MRKLDGPSSAADPLFFLTNLTIPPRRNDRIFDLAAWQMLFDVSRIGAFVIPLRTDPDERTNILLASRAVDSVTVAPGQTFSFNQVVGERTPDRGYKDGLMFDQGRLVRGTGGGICLVATALYNAAMRAGLILVERHEHSGFVSYAPPGCDASVVYGAEDMRFTNDTPSPVVIKTVEQTDRVVVGIYSRTPPPGRRVVVKTAGLRYLAAPVLKQTDPSLPPGAKPVVVQTPHVGYDVTVVRSWFDKRALLRWEVVTKEHRLPRPEIVRVPAPAAVPAGEEDIWRRIFDLPADFTIPVARMHPDDLLGTVSSE